MMRGVWREKKQTLRIRASNTFIEKPLTWCQLLNFFFSIKSSCVSCRLWCSDSDRREFREEINWQKKRESWFSSEPQWKLHPWSNMSWVCVFVHLSPRGKHLQRTARLPSRAEPNLQQLQTNKQINILSLKGRYSNLWAVVSVFHLT